MALARWPFTFEPSFLHPHFNSQSLISIFVIVILSMYNSLRLIITSQRTNYWRSIIWGWFVACAQLWARDTGDGRWRRFILQVIMVIIMVTIMVIIIATRPKPAYGWQGLAGSWGQYTNEVSTFLVFLTSHFAPAALSSDLTNLGPLMTIKIHLESWIPDLEP